MKKSGVFAAMMATAPNIVVGQGTARVFKVGMIGAGGRCSGAMAQIIEAAKNLGHSVKLVAVCDMFENKAKAAAKKFGCDEKFAYWDANSYKKVVASDCEIIVTATPPAFRPVHVEAAIKAGKHVFAEKPVAVDGPGVRKFLAAAAEAKAKDLTLVVGTQRRHQKSYLLQALALQQGKIGKVLGGAVYWNGTVPWVRARKDGMSNSDYLCNNWVNWTELSGDHIVEQHVHNIDVANWFVGRYPRTAGAFGARTRRVSGNQYDFFGVDFDYGDSVHILSQCRQIGGTSGFVGERLRTEEFEISGGGKVQKIGGETLNLEGDKYELNGNVYKLKDGNPFVIEHENLLHSILGDIPTMNEGETVAMATACAVIGRISAYTGQTIRMSDILKNEQSPYYNLACKPSWKDFEAGEVEMPEYSDNQAPLPGKPWDR